MKRLSPSHKHGYPIRKEVGYKHKKVNAYCSSYLVFIFNKKLIHGYGSQGISVNIVAMVVDAVSTAATVLATAVNPPVACATATVAIAASDANPAPAIVAPATPTAAVAPPEATAPAAKPVVAAPAKPPVPTTIALVAAAAVP
jgi:hypothetical protein